MLTLMLTLRVTRSSMKRSYHKKGCLSRKGGITIATIKKSPRVDRGGITETGDDTMLHNEARELLVQGYEATHDAKGIAKAYSVSKWTVYRLAE